MKKIITIFLLCLIVFSGCENKPDEDPVDTPTITETDEIDYPEPAHNLTIDQFHPGRVYEDERDTTSDYWYPWDNSGDDYYFYFTYASHSFSDAGLSIDIFYNGDSLLHSVCGLSEEGYIITQEGYEGDGDFCFMIYDSFTLYDTISQTWYRRGEKTREEYESIIADKTFVKASDPNLYIKFNADGTFEHQYHAERFDTGKWEMKTTTLASLVYDADGYTDEVWFQLDESGNLQMEIGVSEYLPQ